MPQTDLCERVADASRFKVGGQLKHEGVLLFRVRKRRILVVTLDVRQ